MTVIAATAFSRTQWTNDAIDPVRVAAHTHKVAFEKWRRIVGAGFGTHEP
jgi:hypothetical protein